MKKDIHPEVRPVIFEDAMNGSRFKILSAISTRQSITIDGEEYPLVKSDVTSTSHPFYTGDTRVIDRDGRVEKFSKKFGGGLSASKMLKKKA